VEQCCVLDEVGFDEELRLWLSRLGEAETEGLLRGFVNFLRLFKFSISLCRVRRLDAPLPPQAAQGSSLKKGAYYTTRAK